MNTPNTALDWIARVPLRRSGDMSIVGQLAMLAAYPLRMVGYFSRTPETGAVAARMSLYSTAEGAGGTAQRRATGYLPAAR